jgi:hypothetical protein
MSRQRLEKITLAFCGVVLAAALWFWIRQIGSVLELLRMSAG